MHDDKHYFLFVQICFWELKVHQGMFSLSTFFDFSWIAFTSRLFLSLKIDLLVFFSRMKTIQDGWSYKHQWNILCKENTTWDII